MNKIFKLIFILIISIFTFVKLDALTYETEIIDIDDVIIIEDLDLTIFKKDWNLAFKGGNSKYYRYLIEYYDNEMNKIDEANEYIAIYENEIAKGSIKSFYDSKYYKLYIEEVEYEDYSQYLNHLDDYQKVVLTNSKEADVSYIISDKYRSELDYYYDKIDVDINIDSIDKDEYYVNYHYNIYLNVNNNKDIFTFDTAELMDIDVNNFMINEEISDFTQKHGLIELHNLVPGYYNIEFDARVKHTYSGVYEAGIFKDEYLTNVFTRIEGKLTSPARIKNDGSIHFGSGYNTDPGNDKVYVIDDYNIEFESLSTNSDRLSLLFNTYKEIVIDDFDLSIIIKYSMYAEIALLLISACLFFGMRVNNSALYKIIRTACISIIGIPLSFGSSNVIASLSLVIMITIILAIFNFQMSKHLHFEVNPRIRFIISFVITIFISVFASGLALAEVDESAFDNCQLLIFSLIFINAILVYFDDFKQDTFVKILGLIIIIIFFITRQEIMSFASVILFGLFTAIMNTTIIQKIREDNNGKNDNENKSLIKIIDIKKK